MRKILMLATALLLAGCTEDSATFNIDGPDHALTIRRQQRYFWEDKVEVALLASRMPDCRRLHQLGSFAPAEQTRVDVFAAGEQLWNLRMGQQLWQIETETCDGLVELEFDPKADLGQPAGSFSVHDGKLAFEPAPAAAQPVPQAP
jgi:hypothetical protein